MEYRKSLREYQIGGAARTKKNPRSVIFELFTQRIYATSPIMPQEYLCIILLYIQRGIY